MLKLKLQFHSAPGHTTPLRADTFNNLQLNAGIFLTNLDYSTIANSGALKTAIASAISSGYILGATRGGGSFVVSRTTRRPDADGKRYRFKGDMFVDEVDARLSTTIIEVTLDHIKDLLPGSAITGSSPKRTLKLSTAIATTDYLTNLCWVGDLADGRLVLICLKNAINEGDLNLTFVDKGEGTITCEFHASQASVNDYDEAPFEVVEFSAATGGGT